MVSTLLHAPKIKVKAPYATKNVYTSSEKILSSKSNFKKLEEVIVIPDPEISIQGKRKCEQGNKNKQI